MRIRVKKWFRETMSHKIFETNSSFHIKQRTTQKLELLFCARFMLVLSKFSCFLEDWALAYHSTKFRVFANTLFPQILSLKSLGYSLVNSDIT